MKHFLQIRLILSAALLLITLYPHHDLHAEETAQHRTKIAVLPFSMQGEDFETEDMGRIVSEWLITAFVKDGRFEVVERRLLGQVLEEQKMVETGIVTQETATEIGRILGVKAIITGSVMKFRDVMEVNARIIDVGDASIVTAENVSSHSITGLHAKVEEMARKIIRNFPLQGYVVNRKGNTVVIDLGKSAGVKPGMKFMVYEEGEPVRHPRTGKVIYVEKRRTGTITINSVSERISHGTVSDEVAEDAIKYGNMVQSLNEQSGTYDKQTYTTPASSGTSSSLFVHTTPAGARVRILNIKPRYHSGINLAPGDYLIEVSAPGYATVKQWITVGSGEQKHVEIRLESGSSTAQPLSVHPRHRTEFDRYLAMLRSSDPRQVRKGAKYLAKRYGHNVRALDRVEQILRAGYMKHPDDRHYVDAMAYLCKMLGNSGRQRYKATLRLVAEKAPAPKLRKYAEKGLKRLEKN